MTLYSLIINDQRFEVEVGAIQGDTAHVIVNQTPFQVKINGAVPPTLPSGEAPSVAVQIASGPISAPKPAPRAAAGAGVVTAPIPGKMLQFRVRVGERVKSGQTLAVMEAMKMENDILCPMDGAVKEIRVAAGDDVATGDVILVIG